MPTERERTLRRKAKDLGLNFNWSPVNQAYIVQVRMSQGHWARWPVAAVKNSLDELDAYLSDFALLRG